MPFYTIVAGVNGVGKSSFTGVLKAIRNDLGCVIDVDDIALAQIDDFLSKNISFSQETTLSGQRTEKTVKIAKEKSYTIRLFYIGLNTQDESKKRILNRVEKGGHNIPDADVDRRFNKRFDDLTKILPYCDEVHLFDNENGFIEVGEYKNGELIPIGEHRPLWLTELISEIRQGKY